MAFDFNLSGVQATSSTQKRLAPWAIYPVEFKGCRKESVAGKKDPTATYDILKVRFEGEDGYYEESIFYPKDSDAERPTYTSKDGHEYQGASNWERTKFFVVQLITVLCGEEGMKKFQEVSTKFKSFDDLVTVLVKMTTPKIGTKTNLKLVGRTRENVVEPVLPKFVAVNKDGEAFCSDNFIGDKLFFSNYEKQRIDEYNRAVPTDMGKVDTAVSADNSDMSGIDFDSLLN